MLKRILLGIFVLLGLGLDQAAYAQDPEFTQFYANPLYLNPAFAGTARCPRFVLNYRNQWPGVGQYITYNASYDQHIDALSGGIGLLVTSDKAGDGTIVGTNFSAIYSYQINVTREFSIRAGFQATYAQKKLDWSKLTFGDMIDRRRGFVWTTQEIPGENKVSNLDLSAGILGFSRRYFVGFAAHHLTQPEEGLMTKANSKLPMKLTGHAGAIIPLDGLKNSESYISPNILFQKQQDFQQLNLGLYFAKGPIVGGLWYRNQDSFIALVGFQKDLIKLGYSYDVTINKLSGNTYGSHEISFQLQFECKPKRRKFRTISCPSF